MLNAMMQAIDLLAPSLLPSFSQTQSPRPPQCTGGSQEEPAMTAGPLAAGALRTGVRRRVATLNIQGKGMQVAVDAGCFCWD